METKKLLKLLLPLLACGMLFFGVSSCDKDPELFVTEDFEGTEGEEIDFTLENVPAYVHGIYEGYVTINYAQYAYEYYHEYDYYKKELSTPQTEIDIIDKRIAVSVEEFEKYNIPLKSKVYVSADVTNRGKVLNEGDHGDDWGFVSKCIIRKGYLTDLKSRE